MLTTNNKKIILPEEYSCNQVIANQLHSLPGMLDVFETNIAEARNQTIHRFATIYFTIKPNKKSQVTTKNSWPIESQEYFVYSRKSLNREITGMCTSGLSNPCQNAFIFRMGIGIEIFLETYAEHAPPLLSRRDLLQNNWMFKIIHELAHKCFALKLKVRQLLDTLQYISIEIPDMPLPTEFLDPETGRCCILLGHLGDPDLPAYFDATVQDQHELVSRQILFVSAKLLTYEECVRIRKNGKKARMELAQQFIADKSYGISSSCTK